jgi:hypothetical protein
VEAKVDRQVADILAHHGVNLLKDIEQERIAQQISILLNADQKNNFFVSGLKNMNVI